MLVLTRRIGERVVIDGRVVLEVLRVKGGRVRLGIVSPPGVSILRGELRPAQAGPESADRVAPEYAAAH